MRHCIRLCILVVWGFTVSATSFDFISVDAETWAAMGGAYDERAVLTVPFSSGEAVRLVVQNHPTSGGPSRSSDYSFTYDPHAGSWNWTDIIHEDEYLFDGVTKQWKKKVVTDEEWVYEPAARRWTQVVGGDQVWHFNMLTGQWVGNAGETPTATWLWHAENNTWEEVLHSRTFTYDFSSLDAPWGDSPLALMPPSPLVQQLHLQSVMDAFLAIGVIPETGDTTWTVSALSEGSASFVNTPGDFAGFFTPETDTLEGRFVSTHVFSDDGVRVRMNVLDGSFNFRLRFDACLEKEWSFDGQTWRDFQTGESWAYDRHAGAWSSGSVQWRYNYGTQEWLKNDTEATWTYDAATGIWTHVDGEAVEWRWRYLLFASGWVQESEHEGEPASGLPPVVVFQQAFARSLYEACRERDPGLSVVSSGAWEDFSYDGQRWRSVDASGTRQLLYDADAQVVRGLSTFADEYFVLNQQDGSWEWATNADYAHPLAATYNAATATMESAMASDWVYDADQGTWTNADDEMAWERIDQPYVWHNVAADERWEYDPQADVWTAQDSRVWHFNSVIGQWVRVSGGGSSSLSADLYPPLPLALSLRILHATAHVMARGGSFIKPLFAQVPLARSGEDSSILTGTGFGGDIEARFFDADGPSLNYVSVSGHRSWSYQPVSKEFTWTVGEETSFFDAAAGSWTDGMAVWNFVSSDSFYYGWQNDEEPSLYWTFDSYSGRWLDHASQATWLFDPHTTIWANRETQTAWIWLEERGDWSPLNGGEGVYVALPPPVVRQTAAMESTLSAALRRGTILLGKAAVYGFERQDHDVWTSTNASLTLALSYDAHRPDLGLQGVSQYEGPTAWPTGAVTFAWQLDESWDWQTALNPFRRGGFYYDALANRGGNYANPLGESWTFDRAQGVWTEEISGAVWTYDPREKTFTSYDTGETWQYDRDYACWHQPGTERSLFFDPGLGVWAEDLDSFVVVDNVLPLFLGAFAFVAAVRAGFLGSGALRTSFVESFSAEVTRWVGVDWYFNSFLRYSPGRDFPYFWSDISNTNRLYFSEDGTAWLWASHGQQWQRESGKRSWGAVGATDAASRWDYRRGDEPCWVNRADSSRQWRRLANDYHWADVLTGETWEYHPREGGWAVTSGELTSDWYYSFIAGSWYAEDDWLEQRTVFPPLPVLQTATIAALCCADQLIFSPANTSGAARSQPACGSSEMAMRPLRVGASYARYNASAVLLNASLTLENVSLVHTDVARNLARAQLPASTPQALPAFLGGERAVVRTESGIPEIILKNSAVLCHESLVSAGVRWRVTEDERAMEEGGGVNRDNTSSIVCYNRGRALDASRRRGTVFQLGSSANWACDGTAHSVLESSFLSLYATQEHDDLFPVLPHAIELCCASETEHGVSERDRATHVMSLALDSRVDLGWPTVRGSTSFAPWDIPLQEPLEDEGARFDPRATGGGRLLFRGGPWSITARDRCLQPPRRPVAGAREPGLLYIGYGGELAASAGTRVLIDTVAALASTPLDCAGRYSIPGDQAEFAAYGSLEGYASSFAAAAQTTGDYEGNILFSQRAHTVALGKRLQSPTLPLVKKPARHRARGKPKKRRPAKKR